MGEELYNLIKQYNSGFRTPVGYNDWLNKKNTDLLTQPLFKDPKMPTGLLGNKEYQEWLKNNKSSSSGTTGTKDLQGEKTSGLIKDINSLVTPITYVGKSLLDAPQLTNTSGVAAANMIGDAVSGFGVAGAVIGGALKLGAGLEELTATTSKGTDKDLIGSISGYGADVVSDKTTGIFGKIWDWASGNKRRRNNLLKNTNSANIIKSNISSLDSKNQLAAENATNNIYSRNYSQLYNINPNKAIAYKKGGIMTHGELKNIVNKVLYKKSPTVEVFAQGGELKNIIPSGALHARKNSYEGPLKESVTGKGIPVISEESGGEIIQHAEIERDEIIFHKEATNNILSLYKQWKDGDKYDKYDIELEAGKLLVYEILENTQDNTGLIDKIE